ncbi:hypothetical protein F5Y19DRAFT_183749 [Xylariaceae sp. FL1651]|nr:hypothetical protein F5Y19DRAFT_183749 [Xylariaceae sp. FL1651]
MSANKRRKLNTEDPPQPMSAYALRKKLLAQQSPIPPPPVGESEESNVPIGVTKEAKSEIGSGPQKKPKKTLTTRHTSIGRTEHHEDIREPQTQAHPIDISGPSLSQIGEVSRSRSPSLPSDEDQDQEIHVLAKPVNFSSFRPSKSNFARRKNGVLELRLKDGERLVILGSYGIRVASGEVTIYGASLKVAKDISWVHAPHCYALPVIRCAEDAILELHPHLGAQGLKDLGKLSPLFRRLWPEASPAKSVELGETFQILYTSEDGPKRVTLQDLKSPPEWNRGMATLLGTMNSGVFSIMITGPKSSGKSTFGKILTNRLLTSTPANGKKYGYEGVAILDLDPGQPEYGVVGLITLVLVTKPMLSPSFTRPVEVSGIRMVRSHTLASVSPASDPALYIEMAMDLATHYRNALGSYPLIINTPGWIQGTGLDLLVSLIRDLRPSQLVYMSETGPAEAVEALEEACNTARFTALPSQASRYNTRTPAHLRCMQVMAYFHVGSPALQYGENQPRWFQKPLTFMAPWQVNFRGTSRGIFGVMCYDFQTQPDLIADAINGTVLAAVEIESVQAFRNIANHKFPSDEVDDGTTSEFRMDLDGEPANRAKLPTLSFIRESFITFTPEGIPFIDTSHGLTLDPRFSRAIGLVLVRGIDVEKGHLHLLSPINGGQIEDASTRGGQIVLVSGKFDPPSWAYTEDLFYRSKIDEEEGPDLDEQVGDIGNGVEDTKEDNDNPSCNSDAEYVPWIEILSGNQKRGAGSKVWRVRRDLGRLGNPTD